jgi:hypothetical protein
MTSGRDERESFDNPLFQEAFTHRLRVLGLDRAELMKRLSPRRYRVPGGFTGTEAATMAALMATWKLMEEDNNKTEWSLLAYATAARLAEHAVPTYWVGRELIEALEQTDAPAEMRVEDILWPVPALLFQLPKDYVVDKDGDKFSYVAVARIAAGEPCQLPGGIPVRFQKPVIACYTSNNDFVPAVSRLIEGTVADLLDLPPQPNSTADEWGALGRLLRLTVRLLLVMMARPDLVEPGGQSRPLKIKHGRVLAPLWEPNFIGEHYRIPRSRSDGSGDDRSGPRLHLRRGHWRYQAVGPRTAPAHKLILIDPTWVGRTEGDES